MAPLARKIKYHANLKLKVVVYVISYNKWVVARKFGVNEKTGAWLEENWSLPEENVWKEMWRKNWHFLTPRHELKIYKEVWVNDNRKNEYYSLQN